MKIYKHIAMFLFGVMALLTTACTAINPDYKFGDITRGVIKTAEDLAELKRGYCSNNNYIVRAIVLNAIRELEPNYVGICNVPQVKIDSRNEVIGASGNLDSIASIHGDGRQGIGFAGERVRVEPSEVRLCAGFDLGPEHLPSLLYSRSGLFERQDGLRQGPSGFAVSNQYDELDQHEKGLLGASLTSYQTKSGALLL